ncbi:GerAB/ArcD/ProY family transporter [Cohnella faecalis]|uniref:Uncharacterized protein n=1 Tax=Cohnella faecalis TaxID=2315694 RepID=A0A398CQ78_9BACL|nr:GerAB/ArcD/ProY family transporter [Cohnella faecalis]RIE01134.1 hypothetical protein D3H35_22235 [Cohnella faecalis]
MENRQSNLTQGQMVSLLIAFSTGSAIIYIPGTLAGIAGNGAWVSIAGSSGFGMLVLSCILYLHRRHNGAGLVDYCRKLLGKTATGLVMIPVAAMLLFAIPAILTGIGDFFARGMMPRTPTFVFCSLSMLAAALTARAGIKVTARMFVLLVPVMIVFTVAVLFFALPLYDWGRLLPFLDKGTGSALHGFFVAAGFPFGEVCLFSVILSSSPQEGGRSFYRKLYWAFSVTGILMVFSTICTIIAFGPAAGHLTYALYQLASNIVFSGINERVEAVIGIALILGSYMKATIFLIALNRILIRLTGTDDEQAYIYPIGLICIFLSLTLFASPAEFQRQVYTLWPFTVVGVGCTLVFALAGLTWVRERLRHQPEEKAS